MERMGGGTALEGWWHLVPLLFPGNQEWILRGLVESYSCWLLLSKVSSHQTLFHRPGKHRFPWDDCFNDPKNHMKTCLLFDIEPFFKKNWMKLLFWWKLYTFLLGCFYTSTGKAEGWIRRTEEEEVSTPFLRAVTQWWQAEVQILAFWTQPTVLNRDLPSDHSYWSLKVRRDRTSQGIVSLYSALVQPCPEHCV